MALEAAEPFVGFSVRNAVSPLFLYVSSSSHLRYRDYSALASPEDKATWLHRALNSESLLEREHVVSWLFSENRRARADIISEYRAMYSEDLVQRCTSGIDLPPFCLSWFRFAMRYPWPQCDANIIHEALRATPPNLKAATQTICSLTNRQIGETRETYSELFGVSLEDEVKKFTNGDHRALLLSHVRSGQSTSGDTDEEMLDGPWVARKLNEAIRYIEKTQQETLIDIITGQSEPDLATVSYDYEASYGISLKEEVKRVTSGNFKLGLATRLECSQNCPKFFAKVLHKALKDPEQIDHETIGRVIVTRAERDINDIKNEYFNNYGRTLNEAVYSATSGFYGRFLLLLLDRNAMSQPN